jgi:hypothetical protein
VGHEVEEVAENNGYGFEIWMLCFRQDDERREGIAYTEITLSCRL